MYLAMYFLLRIFRRQSGNIGIADLLVIVVIADAAQNGMAGDSEVDHRSRHFDIYYHFVGFLL